MISKEAFKRVLSSYFSVGDIITYGKYLNKRGRIVRFTTDEKGFPAVEIESVPKGNKQNKTLTLFKIRKVPLEKQAMINLSRKVVARYISAFGGWVTVVGDIRLQRYQDSIKVWDLTNAGKKGKKVDGLVIQNTTHLPFNKEGAWTERMYKSLQEYGSLQKVKSFIGDLLVDYPGEIRMVEFSERGVDVQPKDTVSLRLQTSTGCTITATPIDWSVISRAEITGPKGNKFDQDTGYNPRGKSDVKPFYNWLLGNPDKISRMNIQDFVKLWGELGVKFDSH